MSMPKGTLAAISIVTALMIGGGMAGTADAKDTLSGVTQNWDKTLPANDPGGACPASSSRFDCVMNGAAVRDNETGLVWQQSPSAATAHWASARDACTTLILGNRYGWRLPSIIDLTSLLTPGQLVSPALPPGHPFSNVADRYWSATALADDTTAGGVAWAVGFNLPEEVAVGAKTAANLKAWCVRGGMNEHQY
jgi:Protein of unknown function (DUF1566)